MEDLNTIPNTLTVKELQDVLHCSRSFAYNLVKQNDFPTIKIGKRILIPLDEFNKWMKRYLYKEYEI